MIGIQSSLQLMIVRACIGIIAATGLCFTGVVSTTACVDNSKANNAESEWNALVQIGQKISEESLNPPVHQQLCLSAIRGMYHSNNTPIPRSLVNELSACSSLDGMKSVFMEHWDILEANDGFKKDKCLQSAVGAMLQDAAPGARFVSHQESRVQRQLRENQYVGIGIQVAFKDGRVVIMDPFIGGAAQKAGARIGDRIMTVDGKDTQGHGLGEVVDMLRGGKGTKTKVVLHNLEDDEPREYTMTRDVVPIPTVRGVRQNKDETWNIRLPGAPKIAYFDFSSIVGSTAAEFNQLANQAKREQMKGLILDFRNVGASDLHHAVMICDALVGKAQIATVIELNGTSKIRSRAETTLPELPTVVLYDPSVSGTLFMVLSALKRHSPAKLMGSRLTSNGICRRSVELPDQLGAIEALPYAVCVPWPTVSPATANDHSRVEPNSGSMQMEPDINTQNTDKALLEQAVKHLVHQ